MSDSFTIARLGHRGDGIAPGPIYVARTLPGEVVQGAPDGGRIAAPRIVTPSSDRVAPPCPHYRSCGGCALMHASDGFVARWKVGVVRTALAAAGVAMPAPSLHTSPPNSRRRATLAGRRLRRGAIVGFHGRASVTLTAIPDCRLLVPPIVAALPALEALVTAGASRNAELALTVAHGPAGLDVAVVGGREPDRVLRQDLAAIVAAHDLARLTWEGEMIATLRLPAQRFGTARVVPPPGAFLQATQYGAASLTRAVVAAVGDAARIVDLFAGCGTFTLPLAARAEVHAVEGDNGMLAALDAGWRHGTGLRRVTTEARDLHRRPLAAAELADAGAVVIDPPRAGAAAQMAEIAAAGVPVVASVSCNPVSFARDTAILSAAGYEMTALHVVDQFRWSPHVEIAATMVRGAA